MLTFVALLRTALFLFLFAYAVRVIPLSDFSDASPEEFARCAASAYALRRVAVYAIAWLALDSAVGWWLAVRRPRRSAATPPPATPPRASPPTAQP